MNIKLFALLSVVIIVSACGRTLPPAPVVYHGTSSGQSSDQMKVRRGDTVYTLAKLFDVSMRNLMDLNGLRPPYNLQEGQVIKIPIPSTYSVQQEDTLYGISRAFGVDQTELARLNNLKPPYRLKLGQVLKLPYRGPQTVSDDDIIVSSKTDYVETPITGKKTKVQVEPLPPISTRTDKVENKSSVQTKISRTATRKNLPTGTPRFAWPVQGAILSSYGPKSGGRHNDGINIGAPRGTAVRATEAGEVVYAGNELAGFGNLVLIRHAQGWMSAYGHMDKISITRGAIVKKGQTIGAVGKTGSVKAPQLHFEIRKGSKALNPKKYLP